MRGLRLVKHSTFVELHIFRCDTISSIVWMLNTNHVCIWTVASINILVLLNVNVFACLIPDVATPGCWLISDTDTKFRLADLSDSELMTATVAESVRPLAGTFTYLMGQSYAMISFVSTRSMQLWFIVPAKWTACLGSATSQIIILIYFLLHTDQTARRLLCKTLQWKWNKSH